VTQNQKREILEKVDIRIEDGIITEIKKNLEKKRNEEVIDCSSRIVMPGLINAHTHLGMSGLRGFCDDAELHDWLKKIVSEEKRLHHTAEKQVELGMREALRTGTTTVCDMYDPAEVAITASKKTGIRLVNFPSFYTAHREFDPKKIHELLPKTEATDMITQGIGPHSIYGTSKEFLHETASYASKHNLMIHIHVAETREERAELQKKEGMLPVQYLHHLGVLGNRTMLVHMVWVTKGELDLVKKTGCSVVHCPQSNMKLAGGGVLPLQEMHERGINVALGTDSTASNNSLDMFREMHTCALLHKHHYWDATVAPAQTVLDMATLAGAKAVHNEKIGAIKSGMIADLITLDLNDENLQPCAKDRVVSHIVYSANGMNVSEVLVNGKVLVREKKVL